MAPHFDPRLYVILDPAFASGRPLVRVAADAIEGGATVLQVRAKRASALALLELAREVVAVAQSRGIPVIVNDRADIALAAGADGVHVGEDDLPVAMARKILGPYAIVGYSGGNAAAARAGEIEGASYLGTGDVFGTASKSDADRPIGLAGLAAVVAATRLPVVAIGGVSAANAASAVRAGAAGVAVISAVVAAADVTAAARMLRVEVDGALRATGRAAGDTAASGAEDAAAGTSRPGTMSATEPG